MQYLSKLVARMQYKREHVEECIIQASKQKECNTVQYNVEKQGVRMHNSSKQAEDAICKEASRRMQCTLQYK